MSTLNPPLQVVTSKKASARVVLEYCPRCGWLLRAAWLAQELLTSLSDELQEVALRPAGPGTFRVLVDDSVIWDRRTAPGFPQAAQLKRLVRDQVAPDRELGHSDCQANSDDQANSNDQANSGD